MPQVPQNPVRIARRHPRLAAGTAAFVVALAVVLTLVLPATYESRSQVLVSVVAREPSDALVGATSFTQAQMATYVDLVTTAAVLSPVVTRLGLDLTPEALAGQVVASNPFDTTMIDVLVRDGSPEQAAGVADAIAQQLEITLPQLADGSPASSTTSSTTSDAVPTLRTDQTTPAVVPDHPVTPSWPRNLAVGLFAGLCLGLAAAVLREERARSGRGVENLAELTGAPVLAIVPTRRGPHQDAFTAEAFRRFQENVTYLATDLDLRTLVVTTATASAGATSVASELATGLAQTGLSVVLVDANLSRPGLAERFSLPAGPGLTDLLAGSHDLEAALHRRRTTPLAVLTAGHGSQSRTALLTGAALPPVVAALRGAGRVVVVDAPPLGAGSDAALLAAACDGAVLVTTPEDSSSDIRAAQAALGLAGARLLGLVLNRAGQDWAAARTTEVAPVRRGPMMSTGEMR